MPHTATRLVLAAGLLPAAVAAAPAAASAAPALTPLKPCYDAVGRGTNGTEPILIEGTGFTPNALVDVHVGDGQVFSGVQVDASGNLRAGTVPAPFVARGPRAFDITVTEQANPAQTVTASTRVVRLAVSVRPRKATPRTFVRFKGAGFTDDAPVYAHYVHRGKLRRTVRLVRRPSGPCGAFSVRRRQFPFIPSVGRWRLQVDQRRAFSKAPTGPFLALRVDVRRG